MREWERKRGGEHKESARKVYNALKPARHSLLYIKPVNHCVSLGNVPMVPSTHSTIAQSWKWQRQIPGFGRQRDRLRLNLSQPWLLSPILCHTHTHMHTLVCRQTLDIDMTLLQSTAALKMLVFKTFGNELLVNQYEHYVDRMKKFTCWKTCCIHVLVWCSYRYKTCRMMCFMSGFTSA